MRAEMPSDARCFAARTCLSCVRHCGFQNQVQKTPSQRVGRLQLVTDAFFVELALGLEPEMLFPAVRPSRRFPKLVGPFAYDLPVVVHDVLEGSKHGSDPGG